MLNWNSSRSVVTRWIVFGAQPAQRRVRDSGSGWSNGPVAGLRHQPEGTPDEALHAGDTARVPRTALVPGTQVHQDAAAGRRRRAGRPARPGRPACPGSCSSWCPLRPESCPGCASRRNGSPCSIRPRSRHHLGEEAGVEQVQDGVLDPAAIEIDRRPARGRLRVERAVVVMRARCSGTSTRTNRRRCPWCRSRAAPAPPHSDRSCCRKPSCVTSGTCPVGVNSASSGSSTGSWSSGTGTMPQSSQ